MEAFSLLGAFASFLSCLLLVAAVPNVHDQLLITAPPIPQATHCPSGNLLKRDLSCEYGRCGTTCLEQGAFCCGPAGTLATSPFWMCDNGACITSVRGTTGIVDCYDPDNPSGTTQSCIDHVPTTTCHATDRCYTCDPDVPFCQWETYVAANEPTLSWFSCISSKLPDVTFDAATITTEIPSDSTTTAGSNSEGSPVLSTGAIIGIAVGGGVALIGIVAILAYCCFKKRKEKPPATQELSADTTHHQMGEANPQELDSRVYTRSELDSATAYSPASHPATPFSPPEEYARNVEDIDMWRRATAMQVKGYQFGQSPQELDGHQRY